MKLEREYSRVVFSPEVLVQARAIFEQLSTPHDKKPPSITLSVGRDGDSWSFDAEPEFWEEYRKGFRSARYSISQLTPDYETESFEAVCWDYSGEPHDLGVTTVEVCLHTRADILRVIGILDAAAPIHTRPRPEAVLQAPTVFVGHGRSPLWDELKDHLHEKHGYSVEAYETGERAGHGIRDILESMATKSSFAVLVMTGEDEQPDGSLRARQNVVHELGLFQGRLGWSRAVVLLEDGVEEFSNIHGVHQIRFSRGNVRETYGEVLAALRREFHTDA